METPVSRYACHGCGAAAPPLHPFRCTHAGGADDVDHVLRRTLDITRVRAAMPGETNPFLRYRPLFHSYHVAASRGMSDFDYVALVARLDRAVADVDGRGFVTTPCGPEDALAAHVGLGTGRLWVKDETGDVSGSHKARHLLGVMIHLQVIEALGLAPARSGPLAIASCGNAALAAAIVARAAGRELHVFVPTWAGQPVVSRLKRLHARITACPREPGVAGDPTYLRFQDAVARGAVPFCCQGPDNGLTIEGGETLAWEMADALGGRPLDRLIVQVGGGALASACIQGFDEARRLGRVGRLPRVHAVQTRGGFPLARAYDRLAGLIADRLGLAPALVADPAARAAAIQAQADAPLVSDALRHAATHRSAFMWPWATEPKSVAHGILDDETYDWLAVCEGLLRTGGYPLVVEEDTLVEANRIARETTGIDVDHTGSAGLAGLMELVAREPGVREETIAIIFSGVRRGPGVST